MPFPTRMCEWAVTTNTSSYPKNKSVNAFFFVRPHLHYQRVRPYCLALQCYWRVNVYIGLAMKSHNLQTIFRLISLFYLFFADNANV